MGAIAVITRREEPGRRDDFIALFKETKEVVESLAVNLRSIRLFRNTIAGADTWAYQALFEYDDLASWAATIEREQQDSRYNELAKRVLGPDRPATVTSRSLLVDLAPVAYAGDTRKRGKIVQQVVWEIKPGRLADFIARSADSYPANLRSGALSVRDTQALVAGASSGTVVSFVEYADMPAFGNAWKRNDDPEWRSIISSISGADGPATLQSQSVITEVQL